MKKLLSKGSAGNVAAMLLAAAAFVYTCLRASLIPVTHDEAVTYLYHALRPVSEIFLNTGYFTPNNHILNTLFIKGAVNLWGLSEFIIRVPALLGHVLYLAGGLYILKKVLPVGLRWAGMALLAFNPFVLELFSVGRGYALGLGFMILSVCCVWDRVTAPQRTSGFRRNLSALFVLALATFANLSFFPVFVVLALNILAWEGWLAGEGTGLRGIKVSLLVFIKMALLPILVNVLLVVNLCVFSVRAIINRNEACYGGVTGFWSDTFNSLIKSSFYGAFEGGGLVARFMETIIILILSGLLALAVVSVLRRSQGALGPGTRVFLFLLIWLVLTAVLPVLLVHAVSIKYVIGRTAVCLIPLFVLTLLSAWSCWRVENHKLAKAVRRVILPGVALLALGHFLMVADFRHQFGSPYAATIREMLDDLTRHHQMVFPRQEKVILKTQWMFTPLVNFYRLKRGLFWLAKIPYIPESGPGDYLYIIKSGSPSAKGRYLYPEYESAELQGWHILHEYEANDTILAVYHQSRGSTP